MRGIEEVSSCALELGYFFLASRKATHIVAVCFGNAFEWGWIGLRRRSGTRLEKRAASYSTERPHHLGHFRSSFFVNTKDLRSRGLWISGLSHVRYCIAPLRYLSINWDFHLSNHFEGDDESVFTERPPLIQIVLVIEPYVILKEVWVT